MSATLNKTVPWNVKGVGFDAREIAHRAARREGVPVGQWLNGVIRARADELGVSVDDFTQEERLDALVARLAGVAESVKAEEKSAEVRTATSTSHVGASGTAGTPTMSRSWTDDDDFAVRASASRRIEPDRSTSSRATPDHFESDTDRNGRRWDGEILLDQAMELVGRRTTAAEERAVSERQRMRIAALAREVERLNKAEADSSADRLRHRRTEQPAEQTRPAYAQPFSAGQPASTPDRRSFARTQVPGAVEDFGRRDDRMPGRVSSDMLRPQTAAIADAMRSSDGPYSKLMSRHDDSALGEAAARGRDWGRTSPSDEENRAPRPSARRVQTGRRDAIAEIAERQADLEAFERRSADLLNSASHASMETARHNPPSPTPPAQPAPAPTQNLFGNGDPFDNLNEAFAKLTQRLEARLDEATRIRAQAARQPDPEIGALKAGIAALGTRLDAMKDQAELTHATTAERSGIEALRNEIAALQVGLVKLAPQSSIATLESAVRELGGQIDDSRRDGVSDAVLQPIERLRSEVRQAVEAGEVRGAIERIEHQLGVLAERAAANESAGVVLSGLDELRNETAEIRGLLQTTASQFEAIALLETEIGQLGSRIERLTEASPRAALRELELATNSIRTMLVEVSPETALQDLSRKLDGLGARFGLIEEHIAAPMAMFDEFARRMDDAHAALADRLIRAAPTVDLAPIEDMIGDLSGKIDGLRYPVADMQALGGLIRGLAAQIEEARVPNADARILDGLEMQVSRLAERLDKSDASLDAIGSVERLVRDLFSQLDDTRTATIDAAETAARTAAEETLRGLATTSGNAAAPDGAAPAARVLEQVSQELAEFRKAQQNSEKRVHSTLLALNETLQRMVDTAVAAPAPTASPVMDVAVTQVSPAEVSPPVATPKAIEPEAMIAPVVAPAQAAAESVIAAEVAPVEIKRPVAAAPVVDIGRPAALAEPMPDVSPLIAAARRAAQAAQTSAADVNRKTDLWDLTSKSGSQSRTQPAKGWRTLFRQKRRPMLLSVASVVLLLGALEIARLKMPSHSDDAVETSDASAPASTADQTASIAPEAKSDSKAATGSTAGGASSTAAPADQTASLSAPAASAITADKPASMSVVPPADTAPKSTAPTLRTLADRGDAAAQTELGTRYADGRGVSRDIKAAASWFQRAADQGYAPAEYRLGSAYEKGNGVPADASQAVGWYEKAATQGNIRAMHNLAVMAAEGSAGKADYARAATWFTKAAEHGVRDSQYNLAILYARGLGLAQDLSQSYMWFSIAAAQGDADAAKKRDDVATKLDPEKLAAAKAAVSSFKPLPVDKAANDILPPPGGWDVASPAPTGSSPKVSSM